VSSDDRFVTVREVGDPTEAEMLRALLDENGIPCTLQGNAVNALYGGMLAPVLGVRLQVPERELEAARELLEAFTSEELGEPIAAGEPDLRIARGDSDPDEPVGPPPRKVGTAIAVALILSLTLGLVGAGHFYVRSFARGFALLAIAWGSAIAFFIHPETSWILSAVPLAILLDVVGSAVLVRSRAVPSRTADSPAT
jgi:TM2 domain-containing membrane protein YozV